MSLCIQEIPACLQPQAIDRAGSRYLDYCRFLDLDVVGVNSPTWYVGAAGSRFGAHLEDCYAYSAHHVLAPATAKKQWNFVEGDEYEIFDGELRAAIVKSGQFTSDFADAWHKVCGYLLIRSI